MKLRIMFMGLCLSLGAAACAEPVNEKEAKIRQGLESSLPNVEIRSVTPTGAGGLYEVSTNYRETFNVTDDGNHFLVGDLFRVDPTGVKNLTEVTRKGAGAEIMASMPEAETAVCSPRQTK